VPFVIRNRHTLYIPTRGCHTNSCTFCTIITYLLCIVYTNYRLHACHNNADGNCPFRRTIIRYRLQDPCVDYTLVKRRVKLLVSHWLNFSAALDSSNCSNNRYGTVLMFMLKTAHMSACRPTNDYIVLLFKRFRSRWAAFNSLSWCLLILRPIFTYIVGLHFPGPAFQSSIFWSRIFRSCIFHPCHLVWRFPVMRFQRHIYRLSMASTVTIYCVLTLKQCWVAPKNRYQKSTYVSITHAPRHSN